MAKRLSRLLAGIALATSFGAMIGILIATPVLWIANQRAADGPFFSPALAAFGFLVLPTSVILLPIQFGILVSDRRFGLRSSRAYLVIGGLGGTFAGIALFLFLHSSASTLTGLFLLVLFGLAQGLATFWAQLYAVQWLRAKP